MWDVILAIGIGGITVELARFGGQVTISPPPNREMANTYSRRFLIYAGLALLLIAIQAIRNVQSSDELKGLIAAQGQILVKEIRSENTRPIQVNVPPQIPAAPSKQSSRSERINSKEQFKNKAVQLSAEILRFLSDRERASPSYQGPSLSGVIAGTETAQQWQTRNDAEWKRYTDYRNETLSRYTTYFEKRAVSLLVEMKVAGIDVQRAWYRPNSPETIKQFALDLAAIAAEIS